MADKQYFHDWVNETLKKTRRNQWFCCANLGAKCYENLEDILREFETSHDGCKWAYAFHNRGLFEGEKKEHKHFIVVTSNAISGASMMKHFEGAHLEPVRMGVENCGRYLLHLSTGSEQVKDKVSIDDLYCSGKGSHGQLWFPLITSNVYDAFVPSDCMHYVYNDGLQTISDFMARFGSCVAHGAYASVVKTCIECYRSREISDSAVKSVFDECPEDIQNNIKAWCLEENEYYMPWEQLKDRIKKSPYGMEFMKLYIWYRNSSAVASSYLLELMGKFKLNSYLSMNDKRSNLADVFNNNSAKGYKITTLEEIENISKGVEK